LEGIWERYGRDMGGMTGEMKMTKPFVQSVSGTMTGEMEAFYAKS
jgi:hypothetical protein